jgi:hypothetical protein
MCGYGTKQHGKTRTGGIEKLLRLIEENFPVPSRFRSRIPSGVAGLSRLLTSARSERDGGYLNRPETLSAYLRYFLPWNVFRLLCLFETSGPPGLAGGDAAADLGSGPLTLPIALWLACPELRSLELEFRCVDKSGAALDAGRRLFAALCGTDNWKIKNIRAPLDALLRGKKARMVSAVNVFNETSADPARAAAVLRSHCAEDGMILAVEPGNPRGGAFISALRSAFPEAWGPAAPCTHAGPCPLRGFGSRRKWCHFVFDTEEAPAKLRELSLAAGIPKERAAFSYIMMRKKAPALSNGTLAVPGFLPVRIISDAFPVTSGWGRYCCCEKGLVLICGTKEQIEGIPPGSVRKCRPDAGRDAKSGALTARLLDEPEAGNRPEVS